MINWSNKVTYHIVLNAMRALDDPQRPIWLPSFKSLTRRWFPHLSRNILYRSTDAKACWWLTWCFDKCSEKILKHSWYLISIVTMSLIFFPVFCFNLFSSNRVWHTFLQIVAVTSLLVWFDNLKQYWFLSIWLTYYRPRFPHHYRRPRFPHRYRRPRFPRHYRRPRFPPHHFLPHNYDHHSHHHYLLRMNHFCHLLRKHQIRRRCRLQPHSPTIKD